MATIGTSSRSRLIIAVVFAALLSLLATNLEAMAATGPPPPSKTNPPIKWGENPNKLTKATPADYVPLAPARILDTRTDGGPLGKQGVRTVKVTGKGGVPNGATAVVMNVTATNTTAASFLTVWPDKESRPNASNLNYVAGQSVPNLVKVRLSSDGRVNIYNHEGSADVIFDVAGYYTTGGGANASQYSPLPPTRILDTRTTGGPLGPKGSRTIKVGGRGGVPTGASAVVMNVTVTQPTAPSFLTVSPTGSPRPNASNLNYIPGQTVPNQVIVTLGNGGQVDIYNLAGTAHVLFDVAGYYTTGGNGAGYVAVNPARILDTRTSGGPLGKQGTRKVQVSGKGGVPNGASAVVMNVTATNTTGNSFLTVSPAGKPRPNASNLNYIPGLTVPNLVIVTLGDGGAVNMYNHDGNADVLFDVAGYYTGGNGTTAALPDEAVAAFADDQEVDLSATAPGAIGGHELEGTDLTLEEIQALPKIETSWADNTPIGDGNANFADSGNVDSASQRDPLWAGYLPKNFNRSVGRLYIVITDGNSNFGATCSATVVRRNILITAAHCLDFTGTGLRVRDVRFVPNQNGERPSGPEHAAVDWAYWTAYLGAQGFQYDYAFVEMGPRNGSYIGDEVPTIPFVHSLASPPWMWQMGYPAEGWFQDGTGPDNSGQGKCGDSPNNFCKPYSNLSKPADNKFVTRNSGSKLMRMPAYVAGGASGGPIFGWVKVGNKTKWAVVSVVSHGADPRFNSEALPGDSFVDTPGCNVDPNDIRACLWYGTGIYMPRFDSDSPKLMNQGLNVL